MINIVKVPDIAIGPYLDSRSLCSVPIGGSMHLIHGPCGPAVLVAVDPVEDISYAHAYAHLKSAYAVLRRREGIHI